MEADNLPAEERYMTLWKHAVKMTEELRRLFTPVEVPAELTDLTAELLADLHDAALKFGVESGEEKIADLALNDLMITCHSDPAKPGLMLVTLRENRGAHVFLLGSGDQVIWGKGITVEEVKGFLIEIDAVAFEKGGISSRGERIPLHRKVEAQVIFRFDEVFATEGTAMPILPLSEEDLTVAARVEKGERMLKLFDKPDEIMVNADPLGVVNIIAKRDLDYFQRRRKVATAVLAERGWTLEEANNLDMDTTLDLRDEIDRRLRATPVH